MSGLKKYYRLNSRDDIQDLRRYGIVVRNSFLVLLIKVNGEPVSRFGFSASRHVGKAVKRNRIKRLLRTTIQRNLPYIEHGWDCFFIVKKTAINITYYNLQKAVKELLLQAKIWQVDKI